MEDIEYFPDCRLRPRNSKAWSFYHTRPNTVVMGQTRSSRVESLLSESMENNSLEPKAELARSRSKVDFNLHHPPPLNSASFAFLCISFVFPPKSSSRPCPQAALPPQNSCSMPPQPANLSSWPLLGAQVIGILHIINLVASKTRMAKHAVDPFTDLLGTPRTNRRLDCKREYSAFAVSL